MTALWTIGHWRDDLLSVLKHRGTPQALTALRKIAKALNHPDWLVWTIREADELVRDQTWVGRDPQELLELIEKEARPIIHSDEELQEAVLAELGHYQKHLQEGPTPNVEVLWNGGPPYTPKKEPYVSDQVANFLREQLKPWGGAVSREEETRGSTGRKTGQQPDIILRKAVLQPDGTARQVRCAVEVKRAQNPAVKKDMEAQLVPYMDQGAFRVGIYLVVWFNEDALVQKDNKGKPRRKKELFNSYQAVQKWFSEKAAELSMPGRRVRSFVLDASLPSPRN